MCLKTGACKYTIYYLLLNYVLEEYFLKLMLDSLGI